MCVCIHTVYIYVYVYVCLSVCLSVCMYVSMYVCMYVSIYITCEHTPLPRELWSEGAPIEDTSRDGGGSCDLVLPTPATPAIPLFSAPPPPPPLPATGLAWCGGACAWMHASRRETRAAIWRERSRWDACSLSSRCCAAASTLAESASTCSASATCARPARRCVCVCVHTHI